MKSVSDIIDALGGTFAVARGMRLAPSTVSSWKQSGRLPKWRVASLVEFAVAQGIEIEPAALSQSMATPSLPEQAA